MAGAASSWAHFNFAMGGVLTIPRPTRLRDLVTPGWTRHKTRIRSQSVQMPLGMPPKAQRQTEGISSAAVTNTAVQPSNGPLATSTDMVDAEIMSDANPSRLSAGGDRDSLSENSLMPPPIPQGSECHMPPMRIVKIGEEEKKRWKELGGRMIENLLFSGAVAVLDAKYLVWLAETGGVLQRRQDLSDEAFLSLAELKAAGCPHESLPIVVLSYPWLTPTHPDPRGHTLRLVAKVLKVSSRVRQQSSRA